jgi:hypothetical protein
MQELEEDPESPEHAEMKTAVVPKATRRTTALKFFDSYIFYYSLAPHLETQKA